VISVAIVNNFFALFVPYIWLLFHSELSRKNFRTIIVELQKNVELPQHCKLATPLAVFSLHKPSRQSFVYFVLALEFYYG